MLALRAGTNRHFLHRNQGDPVYATGLPPLPAAITALAQAELALRSLRITAARELLRVAQLAAQRAGVQALQAEAEQAQAVLAQPSARQVAGGEVRMLRLDEVASLLDSGALVVDACRHVLRAGTTLLPLAARPILFTLLRALAEAWPGDVGREALILRAFRLRAVDETHRARLRVEMGRLRKQVTGLADIEATRRGYVLRPASASVAVLAPPIDGDSGELVALLADGAAWSTSALALALGASQRTVQRALAELEVAGRVHAIGNTRARRWRAPPLTGFTTTLLLPAALPFA